MIVGNKISTSSNALLKQHTAFQALHFGQNYKQMLKNTPLVPYLK
jgi:hypothetical protein